VAQIIVRNLHEGLKARLRERAKRRGKSMEAEARDILGSALADPEPPTVRLGARIASRFAEIGLGTEIEEVRGQAPRSADLGS
jgi:antitoxin FitA